MFYLFVDIHTRDYEEDPGAPGSSCQQPAQSEDDGSLVLLDHLDTHAEGDGHGDHDEEVGQQGQDQRAAIRRVRSG